MMDIIKLNKPWQQGFSLLAGCLVVVMAIGCGATENNGSQEIKRVLHEADTSPETIPSRKYKSFSQIETADLKKKFIEEHKCKKNSRDELINCLIGTFPIGTDSNILTVILLSDRFIMAGPVDKNILRFSLKKNENFFSPGAYATQASVRINVRVTDQGLIEEIF